MLVNLLVNLGLSEDEAKTYLALLEYGPVSAGALAKRAGVVRATQYVLLARLVAKGFVRQSYNRGLKAFTAEPPEKVNEMFAEKIIELERDRKAYKELLPTLQKKRGQSLVAPKFSVFEGAEGLQNILKDMLLYKDIETQAYWPIKKMVEVLSPEFFRYHNRERIKRGLYTRAIWPKNEMVEIRKHPYLGVGEAFRREIRIAPQEIDFSMGYWIYGTKVAFLSSRKESMGFIVESAELTDMLRSQFEVIWKTSSPLKIDPKDTATFMNEWGA